MRKKLLSAGLILSLSFSLFSINAAAADFSPKTIAQAYKTVIKSTDFFQYANENAAAFYDLDGDAIPEMLLWAAEKSNPSLTDLQVWSYRNSTAVQVGSISWGMASASSCVYVDSSGKLVNYGVTSSERTTWITVTTYDFDSHHALKVTEDLRITKEYEWDPSQGGRNNYRLTCTANGQPLSSSDAQQRYDNLERNIDVVILGDSGHDRLSMTRENAVRYLDGIDAFFDVAASQYYAKAVTWAVENGITHGTSTFKFSPEKTCTRAEILTFLWRSAGSPPVSYSNPFSDVVFSDYYYQAALWAAEHGMVSGSRFDGSLPCTRASTVTYIWQYAGCPITDPFFFTDVPASDPCVQAISWAVKTGITNGTGENQFSPNEICSRGQIATFLHRARNFAPDVGSNLSWRTVYEEFVLDQRFLAAGQTYSSEGLYIISLYDMDEDGIPELKITNGASGRAVRQAYLYTCTDGAVTYLGVGPTDAFYDPSRSEGIYGYYQASANEIFCTLYTKQENAIKATSQGTYTGLTWPKTLTRLNETSLDTIRELGWESYLRSLGL